MMEHSEDSFEKRGLAPEALTPRYIVLPVPRHSPRWTYVLIAINGLIFLGSLLVGRDFVLLVVINLIYGFANPSVDNWGHIGGLLTGVVLGWFFAPEYQVVQPDSSQLPQVVDSGSPGRRVIGIALVGMGILLALIGGIICWGG